MKGIIGCKILSPFYRHMKRVSAVTSFSYSLPEVNTGFVASRYTSQRSYSQKLQKVLAPSPRVNLSKLWFTSLVSLLSLPRIQLLRKLCFVGFSYLEWSLMRSIFGFTNLKVCQILLQNCLNDTILLMFRLIDRLCTM